MSFIGSKLLKFIGLSAQFEPIFAIFPPDLSRYVSVIYDLRCLTIAFSLLLSYLYDDSGCSGINVFQLVANSIIFQNPQQSAQQKCIKNDVIFVACNG